MLNVRMSAALQKTIELNYENYFQDTKITIEDVEALKDWVKKQLHFPEIEEPYLKALVGLYLHSCYYRLEPAKLAIDNTFTARTLCEDKFNLLSEDTIKHVLTSVSDNFILVECTKILEMVIMFDYLQYSLSNGIVAVLDMKDFTFGHLARFNLSVVKTFLYYIQEAAPIRIKGIHLVNVVPFVDKVIALVRPFMKKELYDMLVFHTESMDTLYASVPRDCLPEEYGGTLDPVDKINERTLNTLIDNMDFFRWLDTKKVNENKRQGKSKCSENLFGMEGTFKKLELD